MVTSEVGCEAHLKQEDTPLGHNPPLRTSHRKCREGQGSRGWGVECASANSSLLAPQAETMFWVQYRAPDLDPHAVTYGEGNGIRYHETAMDVRRSTLWHNFVCYP